MIPLRPEPGSLTLLGLSITVVGYIGIILFMLAYMSMAIKAKRNRRKT